MGKFSEISKVSKKSKALRQNTEYLINALILTVFAANESESKECVEYAKIISNRMTKDQIEFCKASADCAIEYIRIGK